MIRKTPLLRNTRDYSGLRIQHFISHVCKETTNNSKIVTKLKKPCWLKLLLTIVYTSSILISLLPILNSCWCFGSVWRPSTPEKVTSPLSRAKEIICTHAARFKNQPDWVRHDETGTLLLWIQQSRMGGTTQPSLINEFSLDNRLSCKVDN